MFDNCEVFFQLEDYIEKFCAIIQEILLKSYFIKIIMVTTDKNPEVGIILEKFNLLPNEIKVGELDSISAAKLLISVGKDKLPRNLRNEYFLKDHIIFTQTKFPKYPCKIM